MNFIFVPSIGYIVFVSGRWLASKDFVEWHPLEELARRN
jgi:hypothetical protein